MVVLRFVLIVVLAAVVGATLPTWLIFGDWNSPLVIALFCLVGTTVVAIGREAVIRPGWSLLPRAGVTIALGAGVGGVLLFVFGPFAAALGALYGAACMIVWSLLDAVIPTPKANCWIYQTQRR